MATWHCPHCGALQAEASRCWVCHRSSTTCSTCLHFRRSLATTVAYCSLDRRRAPLTGRELRACWEGRAAGVEPATVPNRQAPFVPVITLRGFVPVEELAAAIAATRGPDASTPAVTFPAAEAVETIAAREAPTSLFGDAEG